MNPVFYGLESKWFSRDQAYKIYEGEGKIIGVLVGDQFYNKISVRTQLAPLYLTIIGIPIVEAIAAWVDNRRLTAEQSFESTGELAHSKVLSLKEIVSVKFSNRRNWWTIGTNSGTVTISLKSGLTWELILTGKQDLNKIVSLFESLGLSISSLA